MEVPLLLLPTPNCQLVPCKELPSLTWTQEFCLACHPIQELVLQPSERPGRLPRGTRGGGLARNLGDPMRSVGEDPGLIGQLS